MTANDPRRDPSWKPDPIKRVMGAPIKEKGERAPEPASNPLKPSPETWEAAKKWTPRGLVAAFLIGFFAVGEDRIVRIARAFSAEEAVLVEMKALRADLAKEREERAAFQKQIEEREKKRAAEMELQQKQLILHAEVIYLLNGRVAPTWQWPEAREADWISGTDNLHRHVRRGGRYPGTPE